MSEPFEVYVTKYALTVGIERLTVRYRLVPTMVIAMDHRYGSVFRDEGREWHRTIDSAVARAETMRKAKLASLRKSIAKLEGMTFGEPQS